MCDVGNELQCFNMLADAHMHATHNSYGHHPPCARKTDTLLSIHGDKCTPSVGTHLCHVGHRLQ